MPLTLTVTTPLKASFALTETTTGFPATTLSTDMLKSGSTAVTLNVVWAVPALKTSVASKVRFAT